MKKFKAPDTFFIYCLTFVSIFWFSCTASKKGIRAINFRYNLECIIDPESYALDEGRYLYYYKDYTVFFLDYQFLDHGIMTLDSNNVYTGTAIKRKLLFKYYVFKKNSRTGLKFDSLNIKKGIKVEKDTIFKYYIKSSNNINESSKFKLVHSEIIPNGNLVQNYVIANNQSSEYIDSAYCYYSKEMNGIEFSYNQFLDSAIGMKLFKTEIIFNSLYNSKPATEIGIPRILREEMKEIKVKDPALIKALCERYEKEINNK